MKKKKKLKQFVRWRFGLPLVTMIAYYFDDDYDGGGIDETFV